MLSREKVEAVLFKMGMPANVKGFGYIVDSVLLLEEDSKIKTTYLYFKVAQQHGTTGQRVERAIRHAFDIVRSCRGDYDVVKLNMRTAAIKRMGNPMIKCLQR